MATRDLLRRLDQRVLGTASATRGSALQGTSAGSTPGRAAARGVWHGVCTVSRVVLFALAAVLVAAVVCVVLPTNESNRLVAAVLAAADQVAGPFATVFDIASRKLRAFANYGLAAVVYLVLAGVVGRLPGARS